ncbi:MAG: hypothetical protein OXH04_02215 [Acidobacteria bacterium]|nr:hypothetical protein [Acidobacteriota bacterium]
MRTFAALLATLALAAPVRGTTVEPLTFSEVVDGADVIAVGAVSAVTETWDAEREVPLTEVTVSVLEVLKGEVGGAELTLQFLGGPTPGGATLDVAGMPDFAVGDRAVLFSAGNGVEACPLVGWWQGLYRLFYDAGRDAFTVADHAGRPVVGLDGGAGQLVASVSAADNDETAPGEDALTLDDFRSVVRAEIR